jgi:YfiH family protein
VISRVVSGPVIFYTFPHLQAAGARNAAATRLGGISQGPFASLNVGFSVGDNAAHVEANRRTLYGSVGTSAGDVVACHQVHSTTVASAGDGARGRGATSSTNMIPATDALITDRPGLFLFLRFADCVPVLLCDPVRGAVALAHAGWKGTVGNIAAATVGAMSNAFGSIPANLLAAIGPAVGPCHYVVQEDVAGKARAALPFWRDVLRPGADGLALDLPEANRRNLLAAGLAERNVMMSGICTACNTDEFYSHRAEKGITGRFGVLIGWVGNG